MNPQSSSWGDEEEEEKNRKMSFQEGYKRDHEQ